MNVLITSLGSKLNLVKYFKRALYNEGGGRVLGIDSDSNANARFFVDQFICSPNIGDDDFEQWLTELVSEQGIDLIVPSRDGDLRTLSQIKVRLESIQQCQISVSPLETLDLCLNKHRFYNWCAEQQFSTAKVFEKSKVKESDLPVFVKPTEGFGSSGAYKISTWRQWEDAEPEIGGQTVIQNFLNGEEYSVDAFAPSIGACLFVVPRKRIVTMHGESVHGRICLDPELMKVSKQLVERLGIIGQCTVQLFRVGAKIFVSEVNARFGGGFTLSVEAGADSPRYLVQGCLDRACSFDQDKLVADMEMIRVQKDIFVSSSTKKTYCFDLDGTLCTESCSYEEAQPISSVVERANDLYAKGHEVIIASARGAASGKDWRPLIEEQLGLWGVKYTRIVDGKPFADYYVDNKSVDVLEFL